MVGDLTTRFLLFKIKWTIFYKCSFLIIVYFTFVLSPSFFFFSFRPFTSLRGFVDPLYYGHLFSFSLRIVTMTPSFINLRKVPKILSIHLQLLIKLTNWQRKNSYSVPLKSKHSYIIIVIIMTISTFCR